MKRIHHPFWLWEEVKHGMWASLSASESRAMLERAAAFTGDAILYGSYMRRVVSEWRYSCENSLTNTGINRKAWLGHAATALAIGCPEHITRAAWKHLTQQQQDDANAQAQAAIEEWEGAQKNRAAHTGMGAQRVFDWDTGRCAA